MLGPRLAKPLNAETCRIGIAGTSTPGPNILECGIGLVLYPVPASSSSSPFVKEVATREAALAEIAKYESAAVANISSCFSPNGWKSVRASGTTPGFPRGEPVAFAGVVFTKSDNKVQLSVRNAERKGVGSQSNSGSFNILFSLVW